MNELEKIPERKRLSQYILGNARTLIIAFILFTVVVVMTTDIRFTTISSIRDLGLDFFILLFSSYGMYICCADGGIKNGYTTYIYKDSVKRFDELKTRIEDSMLPRMDDFCTYYVDEELRKTRMQYLSVACIPYDVYMEKYARLGRKQIDTHPDLTDSQKKAVKRANRVHRIKLTPEMILTQGRTVHTRSGLPTDPEALKGITFVSKMVRMSFISVCMSLVAFDIILEPSWTVFVGVCLKLFTVIINGFDGHKEGFTNITVHTVNYVNHQSLLMKQAIQYIESHTQLKSIKCNTTEISLGDSTT